MDADPPLSHAEQVLNTSGLIAHLHRIFSSSDTQSVRIDWGSLLLLGQYVPREFMETVWHHAYRRAEDELILVMPTHSAARSAFLSAVLEFPGICAGISNALQALMPFLTSLTPANLNERFHNGLSVSISLNSEGTIVSTRMSLAEQPLRSLKPLLELKGERGYRAFDVFYNLLYSQEDRAELLALKTHPAQYDLLRPSNTFTLPDWVSFADDRALAKDWYESLCSCLPKKFCRDIMTTLSGILLLGNNSKNDRADGAGLIGLDPKLSSQYPPHELIAATYTALVNAVLFNLNHYLASFDLSDSSDISSLVTVVECASFDRYDVLKNVFDNSAGINAEMAANGISLPKTPGNVAKALKKLSEPHIPSQLSIITEFFAIVDPSVAWPRAAIKQVQQGYTPLNVAQLVPSNRVWTILTMASSNTAEAVNNSTWTSSVISQQVRDFFITEWAAQRTSDDYTTDFGVGDFISWFRAILPDGPGGFQIEAWAQSKGFRIEEFFTGQHRIYIDEPVWQELERERQAAEGTFGGYSSMGVPPIGTQLPSFHFGDPLTHPNLGYQSPRAVAASSGAALQSPGYPMSEKSPVQPMREIYNSDGRIEQVEADLGSDRYYPDEESDYDETEFLGEFKDAQKEGAHLEVYKQTPLRKAWVGLVWLLTWWIPSPLLWLFGKKRQEVRIAWREKLVIFFFIFLLNAAIIFYMIFLGRFICPDYDKVWNHEQLQFHQGDTDFYVGIHGNVYDISKFYKLQHSDNGIKTTPSLMLEVAAGKDISDYFPPPLTVACPSLVTDDSVVLSYNTSTSPNAIAMHQSGSYSTPLKKTALHNYTWYNDNFKPGIKKYYKGSLVETPKDIEKTSGSDPNRYLFILNKKIYDVTNYMLTTSKFPVSDSPQFQKYSFFPAQVQAIFQNYQGQDISEMWARLDEATQKKSMECLNNAFLYAELDFRQTAKCQAANVILLVIAGILTSITLIKFLTSLRFGTKPLPSPQDRFVICQIPVYTESEDDVRLAIDSLTNMDYDNQRKLLVVICDGLVVGAGNDLTTPQIVLDVFGVDDHVEAEPRAYHAIAEGSRELNYAQVYSGLYENEGNIVPYVVIVKCGAPNESLKPGNRGKRDSQLLLMNFLSRVHRQGAMSPLDLELFQHINNVIGVEPERYEYLFTVDADTHVMPDSLTRLVAACTNDNKIAAVCGETGIQNEDQSLSTMVQVYEYFISHHLTKAFESLFGSVTCLPGCFTLYRLRTAQRARPLIISEEVIREYSVRHVDTLHKKNLFSLGEDRYLTTLMSKFFPRMSYKFVADARCLTRVPDDFSVLMSQRRRWINSTVHNLVELLRLETMCGFFLFSMRGIVFVDLIGTLMLPSVVIYLAYLIYVMASHTSPLPIISIVLIASVYGLQALVYILHRRWQHIFWMIIYIAAYPFHSFILPIYSFWNMDNFSWGNTRVVVDESKGKRVVLQEDSDTFDPRTVPFETWSSYAKRENIPGAERPIVFDERRGRVLQHVADDAVLSGGMSTKGRMSTYSRPSTMYGAPTEAFDAETAAQIRSTVRQVLANTDLDTMTTQQLRDKVGDLLDTQFVGEKAVAVDGIVDEELEALDDDYEAYDNGDIRPDTEFDIDSPRNIRPDTEFDVDSPRNIRPDTEFDIDSPR